MSISKISGILKPIFKTDSFTFDKNELEELFLDKLSYKEKNLSYDEKRQFIIHSDDGCFNNYIFHKRWVYEVIENDDEKPENKIDVFTFDSDKGLFYYEGIKDFTVTTMDLLKPALNKYAKTNHKTKTKE